MKYLEVERAGRPEAEGWCCRQHIEARKTDLRSDVFCHFGARLWVPISVHWLLSSVGFWFQYIGSGFFLYVRFLSFFQHLLVFGCTVRWFLISVYWVLVCLFVCFVLFFFFWRICGFATICNLLGLLYLFFSSLNWVCFTICCLGLMLDFFSLVSLLCYNFFFLQILVQFIIIIIIFAWK